MKYPVFVTDQVLTAANLNELVEYLNQQNLSTRRNLIGTGITCGLEISSDQQSYVNISCGCGITSRGHLINIPNQELLYYRTYKDQASEPYKPFTKDDGSQYKLWELLTKKEFQEADDPDYDKILTGTTAFDLKELAVLLYLELIDKDLDNCIHEGCDEKGIIRMFNLRKLLIRKVDLLKMIRKSITDSVATATLSDSEVFNKLNPACSLPKLVPHRLNYNLSDLSSLNLAQINSLPKLQNSFKRVITKDVLKIAQAIYQSYVLFEDELRNLYPDGNPFHGFDSSSLVSNQLFLHIKNEVDKDELNIQYAYDFVCDLVKAYDEFACAASEYRAKCCINPEKFPLHLMLGVISESGKKSDLIYRHSWYPSPAVSKMNGLLEELRFNHYKIYQLTQGFQLHTFGQLNDIRITPGKFSGWPFSEHSMAHYYSDGISGDIHKYWNYNLLKNCREDTILSSFPSLYSSRSFVLNPLLYSLHDYEYFRVEGHLGQEYKSVRNTIQQLIQDYNLPVDLLGIKLSSDHLDVDIEDNCFNDIQTTYKCNRDEYLACVGALSKLMDDFMGKINKVVASNNNLLYMPLSAGHSQLPFITHVRHLYYVLNIYTIYLRVIQQQLPKHIKDFKYPQFRISYFIVFSFTLICQILLEYISNLIKKLSVPFLQFMLLKTLFERLIDDCMDAKFRSLYEMYRERLLKLQLGRLFPGYVEGSPGMEHIAGVKEGGTFILVYDKMPEEEPPPQDTPDGPSEEDPCPEDEESKKLTLNVLQYAYVLTREAVLIEEFQDDLIIEDIKKVFVRDNSDLKVEDEPAGANSDDTPIEEVKVSYTENRVNELQAKYPTKQAFIGHLFEPLDEPELVSNTYRVVADFAIPYRCCSSCLQVDELPEQIVSILLNPTEFCFEDPVEYEIQVDPPGGILESSCGGVKKTGDQFSFIPNHIDCNEEEVRLSYILGDQTAQITVKVHRPLAKFNISDRTEEYYEFSNESERADEYEWTVSAEDGEILKTSTEEHFKFYYRGINHDLAKVSLVAIKGKCKSDAFSDMIKIPQEEVKVSIALPETVYCASRDKDYIFTLDPISGGTIEPINETTVSNDKPAFNPSKASTGEITFTYTFQGKSDSCTIKNVKITSSFMEVGRDTRTIRLKSNSDNAQQFLWKVDGIIHGHDEELIIFIDKHPGKYSVLVSLEVSNGKCSDTSRQDIKLHDQNPDLIIPDNFGTVNLIEMQGHSLYSRLPEYDFTAGDRIIEYNQELGSAIGNDEERRTKFIAGKNNLDIAKVYTMVLEVTHKTIVKAKEKSDEEMAVFLTTIYIGELQQLVATVAALDKEPAKNSNLFKTLGYAEKYLASLKEQSININPDNNLKNLVEISIPQLSEKRNTSDVLTKIAKLL